MTNIKFIIISKLLCADGELDCSDDCSIIVNDPEQMNYYSKLAAITIAPSLRNQTDHDFEHYTITHDKANKSLLQNHFSILRDAGLNTTLIPYSEYESELKKIHHENDAVCFSEMDNDDLIHRNAVLLARNAFVPNRLTIHGYARGLKMDLQTNSCVPFKHDYKNLGHIRIMQSFLFDKTTKFYNPYLISHTKSFTQLKKIGDEFADGDLIKYGDDDCEKNLTYVYIKHSRSRSFRKFNSPGIYKPNLSKENVFPDDITPDEFEYSFGISPQHLINKFNEIVDL